MRYISAQVMVKIFRKLRWSFRRISRLTGVSTSTLIRVERGNYPHESTEEKIRQAYGKFFRCTNVHERSPEVHDDARS